MKSAIVVATISILATCVSSAHAASCEEALDNAAYDCRFAQDTGQSYGGCVRFTSPGTIGDLDLQEHLARPGLRH